MSDRDWSTIRHFKRVEFRKDPDRVLWEVVQLMDEMRDAARVRCFIHVAWDSSGHADHSSHYAVSSDYASAVDFHFEGMSVFDQWLFAERFPWMGIGIYPSWKNPGLHVDLRHPGHEHPNLGRRWWRDFAGSYHALDTRLFDILDRR